MRRLKRKALLCLISLMSTLLFLNAVSSISGSQGSKSVLSFGTVKHSELETLLHAEFLGGFHTGCLYPYMYNSAHEAYSIWNPVKEGGYITWSMRHRAAKLNPDGSTSGSFSTSAIASTLDKMFADNIVPCIEFTRLVNWEDAEKSWWDKFFAYWGNWMQTNHPDKFFIFNPACEFNGYDGWESKYKYDENGYATSDPNWYVSRKIVDEDYPAMMQKLREARDDAGLQDVIKIGVHLNYGWWGCDTLDEMLSNWDGFNNTDGDPVCYYDGFIYGDIIGFSTYLGSPDPSNNPSGASWQTTLDQAWLRYKHVWEVTCNLAGKTLPFLMFEQNVGDYDETVTKAMVTHVYTQLVQEHTWCKGFNWYTGKYIRSDAIDELKVQATAYDGYGAEGI